jgi:uncharacterized membrane protein YfcA
MAEGSMLMLAVLFLMVGALYASVGHAGGSGYLAVMALMGIDAVVMRPTALTLNVVVATIASVQFCRAGHFSWPLFWPLAAASIPAAYLGGAIQLPTGALRAAIGVILLLTAARMAWTAARPPQRQVELRPPSHLPLMGSGAAIGLFSGLTGTGGGIFLSPLMLLCHWADTRRTAAIAAPFILVNSLAGLGGVAGRGWSPEPSLAVLALAAGLGGLMGSTFGSRRATPTALRLLLACVLAIAGGKLVLH